MTAEKVCPCARSRSVISIKRSVVTLVVDAVLRHWVSVVVVSEEVVPPRVAYMKGFGRYVQPLVAYFYPDKTIIVPMRVTYLQLDFDSLAELFGHVLLRTNVAKIVSMSCQPFYALGWHLTEAYRL